MAFTRKNVAAAVAGTLSLAMLTGCPAQAPTGTTPSAPASAAPSAPTSAAPTTATSAAPSAQPSGTASGAPSAAPSVAVSAPPASGKTVIVSGTIRNEKGATVDAATITVKSLDASVPYTATVQTTDGSYVVNNVPEGANVEVMVTKDGFTSRRRVQSFQQSATGLKNILNFGVQPGGSDEGGAYFISDYPEISSTTPAHDGKGVDPTKLNFKIVLSEALDEDSRDAFEKAFAIVPANTHAAPSDLQGGSADADTTADFKDIEGAERTNAATLTNIVAEDFEYVLQEGNTFLGSSTNKVKASWNAAGTEVTYTFDGNLQADDNNAAEYQATLFTGADKIEDADGNQLGTEEPDTDSFSDYADGQAEGIFIYNAFQDPDLSGSSWHSTHKTAVSFEVKKDETDPKLAGINVVEDDDDLRIELTFSEPMAAFYGSGRANLNATELYDLENYTFMVGEKSGDLTNMELDGASALTVQNELDLNTLSIAQMNAALSQKTEFRFDDSGSAVVQGSDLKANPSATAAIEVEPDAPTIVNLWINGGANLFAGTKTFRSIKARVEGVTDPAGNNITSTDADKNLVSATI